jgi:hypothetical protein
MSRRLNRLVLAASLLAAAAAGAQTLDAPQPLAPGAAAAGAPLDAAASPMMAQPSNAGSFREWYGQHGRPALVVYFDKQLDQLPPGWQGSSRVLIEESTVAQGREENRRTTVGVQRNSAATTSARTHFAKMFELSLQQEMKRQQVRVLDGTVLHRKLAAANRAEATDIEYDSLKKSARFVFEVELLVLDGECELVGGLKDIHSGDITASVRLRVDGGLGSAEDIDHATRVLVQRLMQFKVS